MNEARVSEFGGLELVSDPETLGWKGAIDLQNVDFDRRGRVRSRYGYEKFNSVAAVNPLQGLHVYKGAASDQLLAGMDGGGATSIQWSAYNTAGTLLSTSAVFSGNEPGNAVNFGTPSGEFAYVTKGVLGTGTLRKWDGAAWTAPTATVDGVAGRAMPAPVYVGVTPTSNRLVAARTHSTGGPNAAASSAHHVWFSDAGDAETWNTNNFVQLSPGDGEVITGIEAWQSYLLVFKETKFFVFYGESTDSTGSPVFNYREVDHGIGGTDPITTENGIYFFSSGNGIYLTNGGPAQKVSEAVDPIFFEDAPTTFWQGPTIISSVDDIAYYQDRLYIALQTSMFVYDTRERWWSWWDTNATGFAVFESTGVARPEIHFTSSGGTIFRFDKAVTTDDGAAIVSRYRSGFSDMGTEDPKTIRRTRLYGTGTPTLGWSEDFGAIASSASVTLGTSPAVRRGEHTKAIQGSLLSYELSASSGAWAVSRVVPMLRDNRRPVAATRPVAA